MSATNGLPTTLNGERRASNSDGGAGASGSSGGGAFVGGSGFSVSYADTGKAVPWVSNPSAGGLVAVAAAAAAAEGVPSSEMAKIRSSQKGKGREIEDGMMSSTIPVSRPGLSSSRTDVPPPPQASLSPPPRFARSTTTPLPSQLNQLQHPYRTQRSMSFVGGTAEESPTPPSNSGTDSPHVRELSYELADSIQMVVQTLLQISPAQVLDPGKEQFTACSLSVPTSSMSAMFTVMKNINYLSANMSSYFGGDGERIEFDIGETLQAIGDSMSGCAAQAGVDLVLYHGDVSLKHVSVYGDEASLRYAITQVIQQVLNTAERGDSVELGLLLTPVLDPEISAPSNLACTIRISHKFATPEKVVGENEDLFHGPEPEQTRPSPNLSTISIRQILRHTAGALKADLPPPSTFPTGRTIELDFPLRRARSSFLPFTDRTFLSSSPTETSFAAAASAHGAAALEMIQRDATLPSLITFAGSLKGKKATLYASAKGCFAQHLTSYLTAWGMLVGHITPEGAVDGVTDIPVVHTEPDAPPGSNSALLALAGNLMTNKANGTAQDAGARAPVSFVFIDDDVEILKERLHALRAEHLPNLALTKRPALANHHRPRSTNHVPSAGGFNVSKPPSPVVILHFTSLSNYKQLKETVQTIVSTYIGTSVPVPEVMIIPKPAGPRRLLAALYTAVTKPIVDSQFTAIATSPMSPSVSGAPAFSNSFFGPIPPASTTPSGPVPGPSNSSHPPSPSQRPNPMRTGSDWTVKTPSETAIPPSPLTLPDNLEYFSAASQKLGTTPSSGFMISSPDGQPAGILFRPNLKSRLTGKASPKPPVPPSMERSDRGGGGGQQASAVVPPSLSSGSGGRRATMTAGMLDFGALHSASASSSTSSPTRAMSARPYISPSTGELVSPSLSQSSSGSTATVKSANLPSSSSSTQTSNAGTTVASSATAGSPLPSSLSTTLSSAPVAGPSRSSGLATADKLPSPVSAMSASKAAMALVASGSSATTPTVGTTRKSSMGPKAQSPPGTPEGDKYSSASAKRVGGSSRKGGEKEREREVSTTPSPISSMAYRRGKGQENNIIPPISVLVVDDNPINQTILSTFMRKKKIKYDIANNGAEAVAKWRTGGFHLILMDIQMPVMDGIEATKEIRRLEKLNASTGFPQLTPTIDGQRTPSDVSTTSDTRSAASPYRSSVIIVALTASSLQSDRVNALAAGCNDFLTKPVSLLWLNNKIIEWGSIKALQMWADLRPDAVRSMNTGQARQAMAVADNLHMPLTAHRRKTPSPKRSSSLKEEQDAAIALASPSGGGMIPQAVQKAIATAELNAAVQAEAARMSASALSRTGSKRVRASSSGPSSASGGGGHGQEPPASSPEVKEARLPPRIRRVSVDLSSEPTTGEDKAQSSSPTSSSYFTPASHRSANVSEAGDADAARDEVEDPGVAPTLPLELSESTIAEPLLTPGPLERSEHGK